MEELLYNLHKNDLEDKIVNDLAFIISSKKLDCYVGISFACFPEVALAALRIQIAQNFPEKLEDKFCPKAVFIRSLLKSYL